MYLCVWMYAYVCMYVKVKMYLSVSINMCKCVAVCTCIYVYILYLCFHSTWTSLEGSALSSFIYVGSCMNVCESTYGCLYLYVCMHVRVFICVYVCIYVYISLFLWLWFANSKCFFIIAMYVVYVCKTTTNERSYPVKIRKSYYTNTQFKYKKTNIQFKYTIQIYNIKFKYIIKRNKIIHNTNTTQIQSSTNQIHTNTLIYNSNIQFWKNTQH